MRGGEAENTGGNMDRNERPRQLRQDATFSERLLWSHLRAGRLFGLKFRRQHRIGSYVVDFFNHENQLAIELDGDSHRGRSEYDSKRQSEIEAAGFRVLRVANDDVISDIDSVLSGIAMACGIELKA